MIAHALDQAGLLSCRLILAGIFLSAVSATHPPLRRQNGSPKEQIPTIEASPTGYSPWSKVTHLSDKELHVETWSPSCLGRKAALLGSFCVPPTTVEMDKDPEHKLPRLTFSIDRQLKKEEVTLFLFDDEANSYPKLWKSIVSNKTCEDMKAVAKATISEGPAGKISGYKNLKGKVPHLWYLVAVDCAKRECPAVVSANITFFHPNSDGSTDSCRALENSAAALKTALVEGLKALSIRNVLGVVGISPFGVFVLYIGFTLMLLSSLLFLIWGIKAESARRFMYFNTFFVTSISSMAYLAMATGTGIQVLRRLDSRSGAPGPWEVSDPMMVWPGDEAHPNPMYDANYAHAKTYPIFYARYFMLLIVQPLILLDLFLVTGVGFSTKSFMWFSNSMMLLCWLAAFWVFGCAFSLGVFIPMIGVLPTAAAKKGRAARRLYGRLMCVTLVGLCISPWLWILVDGSHALPSDLAVIVFVAIDFTTQCLFGMMLLRNAPALADWGDEPEGTRELQGAERLSEEL